MARSLLIRADAGIGIGNGHVMRCLALAQAWQTDGGTASFAAASLPSGLAARLFREGFEVLPIPATVGSAEDALATAAWAEAKLCDWVIVDGYRFGAAYQKTLREAALRVLLLDDGGHSEHYWTDVILDPNIGAEESPYAPREPDTRLLLGTEYAPLRREFLDRAKQRDPEAVARRILVSLGGTDPSNVTDLVLEALQGVGVEGLEVIATVGPGNPNQETLKARASHSRVPIILDRAADMPRLMEWADLAVAGGGSTVWELAFSGVPTALIALADNQEANVRRLGAAGAMAALGQAQDLSPSRLGAALESLLADSRRRAEMQARARQLVDGLGAERAVRALEGENVLIRPARLEDAHTLWCWANDIDARRFSFNPRTIAWEEHCEWMKTKLASPDCLLFMIIRWDGTPAGQVRFDIEGPGATVSINLDPRERGRGLGAVALKLAARRLFAGTGVDRVDAYIKEGNVSSEQAFLKARFGRSGGVTIQGQRALHFILERGATA